MKIIGKIEASTPKYKSIEDIIHILQNKEFELKRIRTVGTCSGHDCIDSFSNEYTSYQDFIEKVYDDFNLDKERIKDFAELDWSTTMFTLLNEQHGFKVTISIGEDNGNTDSREAYFSISKQPSIPENNEYVKNLLALLNIFNAIEL